MSDIECQVCKKNGATVHITEVLEFSPTPGEPHKLRERSVCEGCAKMMDLPHAPVVKKNMVDIWKLLQQSAQKSVQEGGLRCPDCGMTLAEFRSKGRLGCARDYELFQRHLEPLLHRIHNATEHAGRIPGVAEDELDRMKAIHELREQLEAAIREEAYEDAARLRDQLSELDTEAG
ncbi:MAG: UvrB/UvrC motif-containing protein [Planctomycetota bacterium]